MSSSKCPFSPRLRSDANPVQVLPEFRRAVNIFQYLVNYAVNKYNTAKTFAGASFDPAVYLADDAALKTFGRAFDYVSQLNAAMSSYTAALNREKKASGLSDTAWASTRQVSAQQNLQRYTVSFWSPSGWLSGRPLM